MPVKKTMSAAKPRGLEWTAYQHSVSLLTIYLAIQRQKNRVTTFLVKMET